MRATGRKTRGWRRIASAVWRAPREPQIYGWTELDATALMAFIAEARTRGEMLTVTHLVSRAIALGLRATPSLNVRLLRGRELPQPSVDVFVITDVGGGRDLTGVKVVEADKKSAAEVAQEVQRGARALKRGADPNFNRSKRLMEALPFFLLRPLLRLVALITGDLRLSLRPLGLGAAPFGSAMLTSVGPLGLPNGLSPLCWLYRVPLMVLAGEVTRRPWVDEDHLAIRSVLPISASIDHRFADGAHLARFFSVFREYIADPARFEPSSEHASRVSAALRPPSPHDEPHPDRGL